MQQQSDTLWPRPWLRRVRLRNIRGFRDVELDLGEPPRATTVLIGMNGTSKTSLLRAVAVAFGDRADADTLLDHPIGHLVTYGQDQGEIEVELDVDGVRSRSRTVLRSKGDRDVVVSVDRDAWPDHLFVCGYGSGRSTSSPKELLGRLTDSTRSLFAYNTPLASIELTLSQLQRVLPRRDYNRWVKQLMAIIGLTDEKIVFKRTGGVAVQGASTNGQPIDLMAWADGYRLTLLWLTDVVANAVRVGALAPSEGLSGIVLVDEIDQHLHPSMQAALVPALAAGFPGLQVIATTHSPMVALGVQPDQLIPLQRQDDGSVVPGAGGDFGHWSVEDMFADGRMFGTSPYSPRVQKLLDDYQALAMKPKAERTAAETRSLRRLAREVHRLQLEVP